MASTQKLTELPVIQYTGMDYSSVINQIKEIIESNNNWKTNWSEFYNSEAGTLLIQLMAYISDNIAVRQDLLYNENYLSTATSESAKIRLLNQIGYMQKPASAASTRISIQLQREIAVDETVTISGETGIMPIDVKSKILKFNAKDINGKNTTFEVLCKKTDGSIDYLRPVEIKGDGSDTYTKASDGSDLVAVEGNTVVSVFTSETNDGPVFELGDENIDLKTLCVYNSKDNKLLTRVDSFMDVKTANEKLSLVYVVEKNDNGMYQLRFPSRDIVTYQNKTLENRLFPAGESVVALYRATSGSLGNIPAGYFNISTSVGDNLTATISNLSSGEGGEDEEPLDTAVKNGPLSIMTMNRAVTVDDYNRLLESTDMVLTSNSYSPDNEPASFKEVYGRHINPNEVFSIAVLNKNFNDTPTSKLNEFPWIELNKQHVLDEKYVFGGAEFNVKSVGNDDVLIDGYFQFNNKDSFDCNGHWKMLRNARIFKASDKISDAFRDSRTNVSKGFKYIIKPEEVGNVSYISDVIGGVELTANDDVKVENTNAEFVFGEIFKDVKIDGKAYAKTEITFDDCLKVPIDLSGGDGNRTNYIKIFNEPEEGTVIDNLGAVDTVDSRPGLIQIIRDSVRTAAGYNTNEITETENIGVQPEVGSNGKIFTNGGDYVYQDDEKYFDASTVNNEKEANSLEMSVLNNGTAAFADFNLQLSGDENVEADIVAAVDTGDLEKAYEFYESLKDGDDKYYLYYDYIGKGKVYNSVELDSKIRVYQGDGATHVVEFQNLNGFYSRKYIGKGNPLEKFKPTSSEQTKLSEVMASALGQASDSTEEDNTLTYSQYVAYLNYKNSKLISSENTGHVYEFIEKINYTTNACAKWAENSNVPNNYGGFEYDVRVKAFNTSSDVEVNEFGKTITLTSADYTSFEISEEGFNSLRTGIASTISLYKELDSKFDMFELLGYKFGYTNGYSIVKAYGINAYHMYYSQGAGTEKLYAGCNTSNDSTEISIRNGDILFTDNDINLSHNTFYSNFVLNDGKKAEMDTVKNFYYSSNKAANDAALERYGRIIGIEGQVVDVVDAAGTCKINRNLSDFRVKLYDKPQNKFSFYGLTEKPTYTQCGRAVIETKEITGETTLKFTLKSKTESKVIEVENYSSAKDIVEAINLQAGMIVAKQKYNSNNIVVISGLEKTSYATITISDESIGNFNTDSVRDYGCTFKDNTVTPIGDYYIDFEEVKENEGFNSGYNFYIVKTDESRIPDTGVYVNFVNDKTYSLVETEEKTLNKIMEAYRIAGTETKFMKSIFKEFDIKLSIVYNPTFDIEIIKSDVEQAISNAFRLKNIEDIKIGKRIYKSDIYKALKNVNGVEAIYIEYLGYDCSDPKKYPDGKVGLDINDLNQNDDSNFYVVPILRDNDEDNTKGLVVNYVIGNAYAYEL